MQSKNKNFLEIIAAKRDELRKKYDRVLPSNELLFDRFEKAKYLGFGEGSSIYDTSLVFGDVRVGKNVWVGPYTILDGYHAKLTIGDYVSINSGVMIYTHDSTNHFLSGGAEDFLKGDIVIGHNTVIGATSIIGQGVKIGERCLIQANSLVTKNVPDNSIVAGNPAEIIGKIEMKNGKINKKYFGKGA